jgi:hypothetical protein
MTAGRSYHADVLVVGAGLSGLLAASRAQDAGKSVIVLDKGRSVGGRLATRRVGPGAADTGAQFFTVREPEFQTLVDRWLDEKLVYLWSMGWSDGSLARPNDDGHPRYATHGGMNALAKRIAQDVDDVRVEVHVTAVAQRGSGWVVHDRAAHEYTADAVLLTAPVPQSLAMLAEGKTALDPDDQAALERIAYLPCLTGLFWVNERVNLPNPGAIQRPNAPISWIANNRQKGISDEATIITVQADGIYSQQLWDEDDARVLNALRTDLLVWLPEGYQIIEEQLKRWRYSQPSALHPERTLTAKGVPKLVFAGDAFGHPRVEGAALSGLAAAAALLGG